MSTIIKNVFIKCLYCFSIMLITVGVSLSIVFDNENYDKYVENLNLEKEITKEQLVEEYKNVKNNALEPVMYNNFSEAVIYSKEFPTSFVGKLTHYGPDCAACSGRLACNGQNALNGNIYYDDSEFGTVRIVAASKTLPCGSIVRINVDGYDKNGMYAIVLDRGVSAGIIDLLKTSEKASSPVRTVNNVVFDIVRYGY